MVMHPWKYREPMVAIRPIGHLQASLSALNHIREAVTNRCHAVSESGEDYSDVLVPIHVHERSASHSGKEEALADARAEGDAFRHFDRFRRGRGLWGRPCPRGADGIRGLFRDLEGFRTRLF